MGKVGMGLLLAALASPAQAILIDSQGDLGVLNGTVGGNALVIGIDGGVLQGVGNAKTFLTIQGAGAERGYNTSGLTEFQTTPSGTTPLLRTDAPVVVNGGITYLEFAFALNQQGTNPTSDIQRIVLFQTSNPGLTGFNDGPTPNIGLQTNLIFAWSAAASGQTLTVDDFVPGLDNTEMLLLIKATDFNPALPNVVLYVEQTNANDGPDKWVTFGSSACVAINECTNVSQPGSLALLGLGLGVIGGVTRAKQRR